MLNFPSEPSWPVFTVKLKSIDRFSSNIGQIQVCFISEYVCQVIFGRLSSTWPIFYSIEDTPFGSYSVDVWLVNQLLTQSS